MVSARGALLGTPPCSPRAPRGVTSLLCHLRAAPALPCPAPSAVPRCFGRCQGLPRVPAGEGTVLPSLGTAWAGQALGWGAAGGACGGLGAAIPQDRLGTARGWVCAGTERFGCCCHCCGTHGTASCPHWCFCSQHWWCWWGRVWGGGGSPRPGGTPWVLVPMVRPCRARGQGLQGGCGAAGRAAATSGS